MGKLSRLLINIVQKCAKSLQNRAKLKDMQKNDLDIIRKKIEQIRGIICENLGWDELKYGEVQFDLGESYLKHYLPDDILGQEILKHSRVFWNWWKVRWMQADEIFIEKYLKQKPHGKFREDIYLHYHYTDVVNCKPYPGKLIMQECLDEFIKNLVGQKILL
ncbi:MAG: hypothetical protein IRZ03_17990 [Acidobacterium ailaaui]|nr:hypothetical protein [Pseudacidobacterium ailaaui]